MNHVNKENYETFSFKSLILPLINNQPYLSPQVTSAGPCPSLTKTGKRAAMASATVSPNPSQRDGCTKRS